LQAHIASAIRSLALALGAALLLAGTPLAAQDSLRIVGDSAAALRVGVLRPGDVLRVAVYREKEFSGEFQIDSRGNVQIPGLGDIAVGGFGPAAARDRIRERLIARGITEPDLAVDALIRVSVLGDVRTPGPLQVDPGTNLLQILARAGGPSERADLRRAQVVRDGKALRVDLQSAFEGAPTGRYVLYSNDVLYVPRRRGMTPERWNLIVASSTAVISVATFIITLTR
jgi:polysaccharide export outer membrane protein